MNDLVNCLQIISRNSFAVIENESLFITISRQEKGKSTSVLKEKKTHGFSSCIVINICPLQILSMKKAWEYRGN